NMPLGRNPMSEIRSSSSTSAITISIPVRIRILLVVGGKNRSFRHRLQSNRNLFRLRVDVQLLNVTLAPCFPYRDGGRARHVHAAVGAVVPRVAAAVAVDGQGFDLGGGERVRLEGAPELVAAVF